MNRIVRLMLASMLMMGAVPAFSDTYSQFLRCEQDDDATPEALQAVASKWLKAAKAQKGGANLRVALHFPVVATMGEMDFAFVINSASLTEWGTFMDGYEGSPAQKFDTEWDELASCPDSSLVRSILVP